MFGQRPSNDNFAKESDIISGSFIASATNSLTQLNTQLSKLQESSKSIVKSMTDAVSKIKTVDRDMSQRFKKLNADITASRPDFGKFLYKAPPLPLADIAPGAIQEGKAYDTSKVKPTLPIPIPDIDLPDRKRIPGGGNARGGGTGGGGRPGTTPRTGGGVTSETPNKGASPKPTSTGSPEAKPRASVPEAGSRTGAPTPTTPAETPSKPTGGPERVDERKALRKNTLSKIGKTLGLASFGFAVLDVYKGYEEAEAAYDAAIAAKVPENEAMKQYYATMAALVGEQLGSFFGGLGGAKLGAVAGSLGGPVGTIAGGLGGAVIGSVLGADLGRISGEALGDSLINGSSFKDNFNTRAQALVDQRTEAAETENQRRRATESGQQKKQETVSSIGGQAQPKLTDEQKKQFQSLSREEKAKYGNSPIEWMKATQQGPQAPPPPPGDTVENREERGEGGTPTASTRQATDDKANITGAPSAAGPTATTPPAPPPAPRPNQGAGGADVIVNKTTNMSSTSSSGDGQNVTNPNLKMNAHNPFIKDSLTRQVLPEHN
jgi:hypothetical protein